MYSGFKAGAKLNPMKTCAYTTKTKVMNLSVCTYIRSMPISVFGFATSLFQFLFNEKDLTIKLKVSRFIIKLASLIES